MASTDPTRSEPAIWSTLLQTVIFTVLVPGTVTIFGPRWILRGVAEGASALPVASFFGLLLIAAGTAIYLWCAWDFATAGRGTPAPIDAPRRLVVRGLYQWVRNPMYVGVLSILAGESLWFWSSRLAQYALIVFLMFHLFVTIYEERALAARFGDSYREYRATTPRWLPKMKR